MTAAPFDLQDLRRRLDAIDDRVQDLLIERAEIVSIVAAGKSSGNLAYYQPAREAEIIRRLVARHRGPLPTASLVRIWREMLAAAVGLETEFAVAVYGPADAPGFWDLARDHYGSHARMSAHPTAGQVVRAVCEGRAAVGVLPMPRKCDPDPWWPQLASSDDNVPRIIARLPFGARGNARGDGAEALGIGHCMPQPTAADRTLLAVETAPDVGRARIRGLLSAVGLVCSFSACCEQEGGMLDLIEIEGFVSASDPRLGDFRQQLGQRFHRLSALGGYAVPLSMSAPTASED